MAYTSPYGVLLSRGDVEQAAIGTLQAWIVTYLADVERQKGLRPHTLPPPGNNPPPGGVSYPVGSRGFRGGLDFQTWNGDELPLLIVVAQPMDAAERYGLGEWEQWYEIEVAALVETQEEDSARFLADMYGAAVMGALTQPPGSGLGTRVDNDGNVVSFASTTMLAEAPRTEFLEDSGPNARRFAQSLTTIHVLVEQVVDESRGPAQLPADPYAAPGGTPTVGTSGLTVTAVPDDQPV